MSAAATTWHIDDPEEAAAWRRHRWAETQAAWAAIDEHPAQDDYVRAQIRRWIEERPSFTGHSERDVMYLLARFMGAIAEAKSKVWTHDRAQAQLGALVRFDDALRGDRQGDPVLYFLAYGEKRPGLVG